MVKNAKNEQYRPIYILYVCFISAFGGLLFGVDQGFVNGSLHLIAQDLNLTTAQSSFFAGLLLIACVFGAFISGFITRTIGRRNTLLISALVFAVFSFLSSLADSYILLCIYRFFLGLAVGISSFVVPLYLSEIAPAKYRGGFVAMYQMMITVGIFMVYVTNYFIAAYIQDWRPMFYVITIPAVIMLIGLLFIPKSPRWLMLKNRYKEAEGVLTDTREYDSEISEEIASLQNVTTSSHSSISVLKEKAFLKVLLLGISIMTLQQIIGINAVIYYSTYIFRNAGVGESMLATVIVGLVNMCTTAIAVKYVDSWGRKPILYFGYITMTITLLICSILFLYQYASGGLTSGLAILLVVATLVYIFAFAISAGPIGWLLCAEIFPLKVRDIGVTATTATTWIVNWVVVQFSLPMMQNQDGSPDILGGSILFGLFGFFCILGILMIKMVVPETKGVSLEQVETNLRQGKPLKEIGQ
jgi:SP family galactose:H+ symporter-like MFS transporter